MKKGKIILISGPSGVGKKTILDRIIADEKLNLNFSISFTTRPKREYEIDGRDYYFVTEQRFLEAIENNELIEHVKFCGNYYGTPKKNILDTINQGKNILLEIEVEGAKNVLKQFDKDDIISIFITPPSLDELKQRLINRNTESIETIEKRIAQAEKELEEGTFYQFVVVNDEIDETKNEIEKIIINNA